MGYLPPMRMKSIITAATQTNNLPMFMNIVFPECWMTNLMLPPITLLPEFRYQHVILTHFYKVIRLKGHDIYILNNVLFLNLQNLVELNKTCCRMDATLLASAYMYHPIVSYHGFLNANPWSYIPR